MLKIIILIFLFTLIYNFIYPIRLRLLPGSEMIFYSLVLSTLLINYSCLYKLFRVKSFLYFFVSLMLLFSLGTISFIYNESEDVIQFVMIIKYIFAFLIAALLSITILKVYKQNSLSYLLNIIIFSGFLVSLTCLMEFFSPTSKAFFAQIINTSGNIVYEDSFRVHGLATGGGASLSIGLMLSSLISLLMFERKKLSFISFVYLFCSLIMYISLIFVGRTGFFILSFFFFLYIIKNFSILSIFILLIFTSFIYYFYLSLDEAYLNIIYGYGLEPLKNFIEKGEFTSKTTNHLASMFYLPDVSHLLIGAGFWRYPNHGYLLSDVGYIKVLMSFGVFGFIIFYSLQFYIYTKAFNYYSKLFRERLIFFFVFFSLFIVEFKEAFFTQNYGFKILILLFTFQFIKNKLYKNLILNF